MLRVAVIAVAVLAAVCSAQQDPNVECFQNAARRNPKGLYKDNADCHNYYQCQYLNATYAIAHKRNCPAGSFWHDAVVSCLPEGETACVDRCLDTSVAKSCFAGTGCRHFYVCANTGSYGMCCPAGTAFNEATCSCDESATCNDNCVQDSPRVKTTVRPAQRLNNTHCIDSFGITIRTIVGLPNAFFVIGDDGSIHDQQFCAEDTLFDLDTCRCDLEGAATTPAPTIKRQAALYLNFDADLKDLSVNKYSTFAVDEAQRDTSSSAFGGASLAVNGGYLSVPGLSGHDFRNSASFCLFFRCSGTNGACSGNAGLLSNNRNAQFSEYTVVLAHNGSFAHGRLNFWQPVGSQSTASALSVPSNGWNHLCLIYNSNSVVLHLNGVAGPAQFIGGFLQISSQELVIGTDAAYGNFNGHIDDVLITGFAMTQAEIDAHRTNDRAFLAGRGFW